MKGSYLNDAFFSRLETLSLELRADLAGFFGGKHLVRTYGQTVEFADYREYQLGDDIRRIDWNLYSRFEKYFLKLFTDERQMHTRIYIDASRSMDHGADGEKAEQAIRLAAALAYLSVCEMDKVSIYAVRGGALEEVVSGMVGKDSYLNCVNRLNSIVFDGDARLSEAIVPSQVGRGDGLSVIISDFLTEENYEDAIDRLCTQRRDVLCVQILSREELNPQIRGRMHLWDVEEPDTFFRKKIDRDVVIAYKEALRYVTDRIRLYCESREARYLLLPAFESMTDVLFGRLQDMEVTK